MRQSMWNRIKSCFSTQRKKSIPPVPSAELIPHVVFFTTPANFDYKKLDVGSYKGLLYAEALGGGTDEDSRLLTAWRDKRAYEAAKPRFLGDTCLGDSMLWEGFYLDTLQPHKRWWKQLTFTRIWASIATLFLVLGYVEKIRDASGWLLGPPAIEMSALSAPIDVPVKEQFKFDVTARNIRKLGDCFIEFTEQSVDPPNGLTLDQLAVHSVPAVSPNGKAILSVSGVALHGGEYEVIVKGRASAGLIPSTQEFKSSTKVRVWEALALGWPSVKNISAGGRLCEAEFELRSGRSFPSGIEAEAKLERVPGVRFLGVRFPGVNQFTSHQNWNTPGKEVVTLEWRTQEIFPMRVLTFNLIFEDVAEKGKTSQEWEIVVHSVKFTPTEAH